MSTKTPINDSTLNPDDLFVKYTIPEVRALEQKTRSDVEKMKQELRQMVGERYRDLIDAADSIVNMRHCAISIQQELINMQDSCDVDTLKRSVRSQIDEGKKGIKDGKKHYHYTAAAQIKLLVDVPEQIWRSLENHKYLNASRLYLIARLVYKNLQVQNDDVPFNISVTFPVVQRQWDAVSHFKSQILQKATQYLKAINQTEQSLAETLCAIMLLDDITKKDVFHMFLDRRTFVLMEILENSSTKNLKVLVQQFKEMINVIKNTVYSIGMVFIQNNYDDKSLFESYLEQLQKGFTIYNESTTIQSPVSMVSPRDSKMSLTRLYSPSTNIHLLLRYLPESIQTFTPSLLLTGQKGQFSQDDIKNKINIWLDHIIENFQYKLIFILDNVSSAKELNELRNHIWGFLKDDEITKLDNQSSTKKTHSSRAHRTSLGFVLNLQKINRSWNIVTYPLTIFGKYFSIWNDLLRQSFNNRFQNIIQTSFLELSEQPEKLLKDKLPYLDNSDNEDCHLGNFIWTKVPTLLKQEINQNTATKFKNYIERFASGQTSYVNDAKIAFDKILKNIREDLEPVFLLLKKNQLDLFSEDYNEKNLFHSLRYHRYKFNRYIDLLKFLQENFINSVTSYRNQLYNLLQELVPFEEHQEYDVFTRNNDLYKVGSSTLHEDIIKELFTNLSIKIFHQYKSFIVNSESFSNLSEKGAIQLLYDVKFLIKVFEGCWALVQQENEDDENIDYNKLFKEKEEIVGYILKNIKQKIDPIDLAIFESYLNKNIERHYTRSSIMLGLLFQLNPKVTDM
ncbi:6353_t:CDS:10 [Entrophospora sp. SA101]|nr:6353_t:CDS:10 [Entrophospora sp. SA101]